MSNKKTTFKAIDTPYRNHLFRSRLEARYAVYFDFFGIGWEYETEGYEFGNGEKYLPDFYLPTFNLYVEIKPIRLNYKEISKCKRLAVNMNKNVISLVGLPSTNTMNVYEPYQHYVCSKCGFIEKYENGKRVYCQCHVKHDVVTNIREQRAVFLPYAPGNKQSYVPLYYTEIKDDYTEDPFILEGIKSATQARFEFNDRK